MCVRVGFFKLFPCFGQIPTFSFDLQFSTSRHFSKLASVERVWSVLTATKGPTASLPIFGLIVITFCKCRCACGSSQGYLLVKPK